MKDLDKIDRKILALLQTEGRITNADLAKRIHLSPTPCLERVRRLERDGYILGYRAELSAEKLNCAFAAFMTVNLDRTTEDVFHSFAQKVARFPEVVECHMVGGGFDYLLKIRVPSMTAFRKFMSEKLSIMPEVAQTHSYFVMDEIKESKTLPLDWL